MPSLLLFVLPALGCSTSVAPFDEPAAVAHGQAIAMASFKALSTRLDKAVAEGGPAHAVDLCTVVALPLVDSLSALHGVRIKRTSDRVRAPHDTPDAHERLQLDAVLQRIAEGAAPTTIVPQAFVLGDSIAYYQPIFIASPVCLNCHGTPGMELDSAAYAVIRERYPDDAATGYVLGEFRGLWSIRWER